ncbi:MAG: CoF synthetase [Kamptonema sp. SIO1D9]|nr:CoF synthetase [Kamptonema sp. SIO1D9]
MDSGMFAQTLAARFADCKQPQHAADALADLFRWTFANETRAAILQHALQRHLLEKTLAHAHITTPFYQKPVYQESLAFENNAPPDLRCWPVITRADLVVDPDAFLAKDATFGSVSHTSGCTGPSLSVYKSKAELQFLWDYHLRLMKPVVSALTSRPLVLSMPNLYHGTPVRVPSIGKVFVTGVTDDLLLHDTASLLNRRFSIPGHDECFSIISGLGYQMLFFTNFLLEQGIDPASFEIKSINIVGGYISERGREYLADAWGAIIFDRFSLTESAGGATRCHKCGYFHLDPHVIGEVLDADGQPITSGVGRLVLTQLYPFIQMQPLIRYDTGDLVRLIDSDCHHFMTFEFAGKASNSVVWVRNGRTSWPLLSVDLYEAISDIPDIRRFEQFSNVRSVTDTSVGSLPIFTVKPEGKDPLTITITFELRYASTFYPKRVDELRRAIVAELLAARPELTDVYQSEGVVFDIQFVGPGKLGDAHVLKI